MKQITIDPTAALQALINSIQEFAFTDRGQGHYVKCNGYKVELDLQYCPTACECKDYQFRQAKLGGSCKHMKAVSAFYAPAMKDLLNEYRNPIVWVSRLGRMVRVRWTQLSQNEARAYYRSESGYSQDYHINIYA